MRELPSLASTSLRTRLLALAMVVCLAAVSCVIWTTPSARRALVAATPLPKSVQDSIIDKIAPTPRAAAKPAPKPDKVALAELRRQVAKLSARVRAGNRAGSSGQHAKPAAFLRGRTMPRVSGARSGGTSRVGMPVHSTASTRGFGSAPGAVQDGSQTPSAPKAKHCWDFTYQQDAQAAYVADLRDPWGLDGAPGPSNGDGLACTDLPVDTNRAASTPVGAYVAPMPTAPAKAALVAPRSSYFGVFTEQAPFVMSDIDALAEAVGKMPNAVTYFSGWDKAFRADAAIKAWRRGMLPIVSWESREQVTDMGPGSNNAVDSRYALKNIIAGDFDAYIDKWAADVKALGLPIGLRFDHEMNGYWYPWSEQTNGNAPGEYVCAWRHVHDRFARIGASNVIWIWSPNLVGSLENVDLAALYPGDDYVDWSGLVGYYRKPIRNKPATFANTFGESLAAVRAVSRRPIYLSELGATETGGNKAAWIRSLFEALPQNPDIMGFSWFNLTVTAVPNGEKLPVTNDWRIQSSASSLAAFRDGVADDRYGEGNGP